jgi:hypothetical protein
VNRIPTLAALALVLLFRPAQASAQDGPAPAQSRQPYPQASRQALSAQQQEVWSAVQERWHAGHSMDIRSPVYLPHPDFRSYPGAESDPRAAESLDRWIYHETGNEFTVGPHLMPIEIVVDGDTALAHYDYYAPGRSDRDEKQWILVGRLTDTLAKDGDQWRFLLRTGRSPGPER